MSKVQESKARMKALELFLQGNNKVIFYLEGRRKQSLNPALFFKAVIPKNYGTKNWQMVKNLISKIKAKNRKNSMRLKASS